MDGIKHTVDGVEYTLEHLTRYMHHRIMAMIADGGEERLMETVGRAAYRFLPYILIGAPGIPARARCEIDGVPCQRIDPVWVANSIEGLTAIALLRAALDAAKPSETETKN